MRIRTSEPTAWALVSICARDWRFDAPFTLAPHHLARDRDDRQRVERLQGAYRADGLVPVHDRHHDVHQHDADVWRPFEGSERVETTVGRRHNRVSALEQRSEREHVSVVVVHDEHLDSLE
jgi:hypothetical protein